MTMWLVGLPATR